MRQPLLLGAMGIVALLGQSVAALYLPRGAVPDFCLLVVVSVGLYLPGARGLLVVAGLGYAADLLSGALLGQYALLRAFVWGAARLANQRLDLRRTLPLVVFVAVLTPIEAGGVAALTRFFAGHVALDAEFLRVLCSQLLVNALAAPVVFRLAGFLLRHIDTEAATRRPVRLEPRRPLV